MKITELLTKAGLLESSEANISKNITFLSHFLLKIYEIAVLSRIINQPQMFLLCAVIFRDYWKTKQSTRLDTEQTIEDTATNGLF